MNAPDPLIANRISRAQSLVRNAIAELRDAGCEREAGYLARALRNVQGIEGNQSRMQSVAATFARVSGEEVAK